MSGLAVVDSWNRQTPSLLIVALSQTLPARLTIDQQIMPDPSRAVGPVTLQEARPDLGPPRLVVARARAWRPPRSGTECPARDTERLTQPSRRSDPPVLSR